MSTTSVFALASGLYTAERLPGGIYVVAKLDENAGFQPLGTFRVAVQTVTRVSTQDVEEVCDG